MSDLFFNKNRFVDNKPTTLAKPIEHDPNKLGRRTIEDIKGDMHPLNKPQSNNSKEELKDLQFNQSRKIDSLKAFKEWNKK